MSDLQKWENIIKEKRKKTNFRDFLKEIASFSTFVLYKNNGIISKFPDNGRTNNVISYKDFEENRDNLCENGIDYNFDLNFFDNYKKLFLKIDIFSFISYGGVINSNYADMVLNSKNCYLSSTIINNCEDILYSFSVKDNCKNVINSVSVYENSENIYSSTSVLQSFKIFYSYFINNSNNIWFSSDLTGCSECIFCDNLDNCSYYISNKAYSKDEYLTIKNEILKDKLKFSYYHSKVKKLGKNNNSTNVVGLGFSNSMNIKNGYFGYNVDSGKNLILVGGISGNKNMYDVFLGGSPTANDLYGIMGANGENTYISMNMINCSSVFYSYFLNNCSFCLGCIGLKNKSFCILNKQYSKEEWYELAEKIFAQMEKDGTLGEFFPGELNPFYFNDTMAYLIDDSFTKEEVEKQGYMWREEEIKVDIPEGAEVVYTNNLGNGLKPFPTINDFQGFDSNGNWQINPEILKKVIKDSSGNIYKIVPMEYEFLMKYGLPLPEIHWLDRIKMGFKFN